MTQGRQERRQRQGERHREPWLTVAGEPDESGKAESEPWRPPGQQQRCSKGGRKQSRCNRDEGDRACGDGRAAQAVRAWQFVSQPERCDGDPEQMHVACEHRGRLSDGHPRRRISGEARAEDLADG